MKALHFSIIFLLVMIIFPFNTILAQNQNQPTIEFGQASYSTSSMNCDPYHQQKITAQTIGQNKVTITVTDPNANKFGTSIDRVVVSVWSDSDRKGIEITAYETEVNSGVFKGKVTISDGQSTQDVIHVINGDTLSARYAGTTSGSFDTTSHGITTTSFIGISCPPFERVPASSIRILDTKGNEHNVTTVGKQVLIISNISNVTPVNQNFTYIIEIQDKNGSTESLAWLSGIMLPNQTSSPSISWTPSKTGNYAVSIFVWQSLTNPNALSAPLSTDLTVLHDSEIHPKSPIGTVENLHCKLGYELISRPIDGSSVCVTPNTAQKLAQRGWKMTSDLSLDDINNSGKYGTLSGIVVLAGGPSSLAVPKSNYEVDVYATDGTTVVGKTFSDVNAHYSIHLLAGNYTVYVPDYPDKQTHFVSVFPGTNTIFNIAYGAGYK